MGREEDNPFHVDNLDTIPKLRDAGFVGMDADLSIALFEYGLAWRNLGNGEWLFVYGIAYGVVEGEGQYTRFDRVSLQGSDFESDFDWVDFDAVCSYTGVDRATWHEFPLCHRVADLVSYYGAEEIFGTSYWHGFTIEDA